MKNVGKPQGLHPNLREAALSFRPMPRGLIQFPLADDARLAQFLFQ